MSASFVVIRSELIETVDEARAYYACKLAGSHAILCAGYPVTIVFERDMTHAYSDENGDPEAAIVRRRLAPGRMEERRFCVRRARLMDKILPSISRFTVSVWAQGARGREKRLLYGPPLSDGHHMLVALRRGPGEAFTCVSAYPVNREKWLAARRAKLAKFPP